MSDCYCWDPRDCAAAEPCYTVGDRDRAIRLLDGPCAKSFDQYDDCDRAAIRRVAIALAEEQRPCQTCDGQVTADNWADGCHLCLRCLWGEPS